MALQRLGAEEVYHACDIEKFSFNTTADIEPLEELSEALAQPRAVESLKFGTGMKKPGFNIFALGPPGTGRHSLVRQTMDKRARQLPVPSDWCYVNNFEDSSSPRALSFPAGQGRSFADDMKNMILEARNALKASFESEEYQNRLQSVQQEFKDQQQKAFEEVNNKAQERGLSLVRTPNGIAFAPLKEDGEVMPPDEYQSLPEDKRKEIEKKIEEVQEESQKVFQKIPQWQKEIRQKIQDLNNEVARYAISPLIDELRNKYGENQEVSAHLDSVENDILNNLQNFMTGGQQGQGGGAGGAMAQLQQQQQGYLSGEDTDMDSPATRRYKVNLLVDNSGQEGAPVIYEDNPTYANLVGKVEHMSQMGALITDFNLIKPGSLHRANGGSLILDARKVLTQPGAWEGLKRTLKSGHIKIESLAEMFSLLSTVTLEPEPIDLDVKVVMIGSPFIYYILQHYDPEFSELFKVAADFDVQMHRDEDSQDMYARLIKTIIDRENLRHFHREAVGRMIEHSSREVGDGQRLSTRVKEITDLMIEADYWAGQNGNQDVGGQDVEKAVEFRTYRSDRLRQRIQEEIERGTLMIDSEGTETGQINGLSVLSLGDFMFGRPNRITALTQMGKGEVIDIEREAKLGGPLHSKGVLILSGFLGARYAADRPLSLKASLVFEQSYGGIEGDSASSAELFALLSAISGAPVKQGLAVTGSVNQFGQIQAIGGVNEKIEGFFDVCSRKGLTGDQGVLIPEANVKHLMLRKDVVDAVADEKFHIYPIKTVDDGLELLTGLSAGKPDENGNYPEDTVNGMVQKKLAAMAENMRQFSQGSEQGGQSESGK
ncbi:MAG: AAA family ATPase [Desulfobacterales bacterium]|nr:AAA family ATPase [Desulfobacterales bacterium]